MQLLAERTTNIECPVETCYAYASNLERFGEWFPGVIAIMSGNDLAPTAIGKQYLETVAIPLRGKRDVTITVKEAEPNRLLVTEGSLVPLLPRMEMHFWPTAAGFCRITWRMYSRNDTLLARLIIVPLARRVLRGRAAAGLARLKQTLEHPGAI